MNTSKLHRLTTRVIAAVLAAGTTWMLFGGVISISEPQRNAMYAAIAARQAAPMPQATVLAAAPAPHSGTTQTR